MTLITAQKDYEALKEEYLRLKWKERYLEIINDFTFCLMKLHSIEDIVWGIAREVIAKMEFEDCVVYLLDKEKGILIQKAAYGPKNPEELDIKNPITIKIGEGIVGTVALTGTAEIISNTKKDKRYILDDDYRLSEITVPIIYEDEVIGVIDSEHSEPDFYTQEHLKILTTIAAISANKIKHGQAAEQLQNYQRDLELEVDEKTKDLQQAIEKLKRSNQDLESFAYAASHDLQEPLRTIISYIQLIKRKEKIISLENQEYFDYVISGSKRMKDLLQGLLAYSRITDTQKANVETINMNDLLFLITSNLNSSIKENDAEIIYNNLHEIKGNKIQIIQLFQNIISNALKFRKENIKAKIEITSIEVGQFYEFYISDNGIGIDKSYHDKIFSLFSRLNPVGTFSGSGIGLALCKRIVEYHNGEISLTSTKGIGTTFCIKLPIN